MWQAEDLAQPQAFVIREAQLPAERPRIDEIHSAAFEHSHRAIVGEQAKPWFDPAGACFVAETQGILCGFIYVLYEVEASADIEGSDGGEQVPLPNICDLFVHPAFQHRGVGKSLMNHGEDFIKGIPNLRNGEGIIKLHLAVFEADKGTQNFYKKLGWNSTGRSFKCTDDRCEYVLMNKELLTR